jgi:hypothetical protein
MREGLSRNVSGNSHQLSPLAAPDAETAIKEAIKKYEIKNPRQQKRLMAQRRDVERPGLDDIIYLTVFIAALWPQAGRGSSRAAVFRTPRG